MLTELRQSKDDVNLLQGCKRPLQALKRPAFRRNFTTRRRRRTLEIQLHLSPNVLHVSGTTHLVRQRYFEVATSIQKLSTCCPAPTNPTAECTRPSYGRRSQNHHRSLVCSFPRVYGCLKIALLTSARFLPLASFSSSFHPRSITTTSPSW